MQTTSPSLSWYDVPSDIKHLLLSAADSWENTNESEQYIHEALARADVELDVLVAAYRYFFYKNNNRMALKMATQVLDRVKLIEQLPENWEELQPIAERRKEEPMMRLYLNAYAASGFVLARLGELEQAQVIAAQVKEIDTRNEFGASVLLDILTRSPDEDEDEDEALEAVSLS